MAAEKQQREVWGSARFRRFVSIAVGGTLCLYAILFIDVRERIQRGYPDFTVYYTAATMLREGLGHELYNEQAQKAIQSRFAGHITSRQAPLPYIHPPYEALFFVPLTYFSYARAFAVWDLLNAAALYGVYRLLRRSVARLRLFSAWEFVLAALAFFPVFACFLQGQDSILLLLICVLAFNAMKRNNDFLAGCWFALGLFKFQLVLPIVLLVTIWKRRRVQAGFVPGSIILVGISACLTGWTGLVRYPIYVLDMANAPALGGVSARLLPNLHGLVLGWPLPFSTGVGNGLVALISVAVFWFAAVQRSTIGAAKLDLQISLAVAVGALVGWQTNTHDLSLLVLPLILGMNYCLNGLDEKSGSVQESGSVGKSAKGLDTVLPAAPLLIGPLWIVLWLVWAQVNLMALPVLWWTWEIGKNLSGRGASADAAQCSA